MKIEYKLIEKTQKGFVLTREPKVVYDDICLSFLGAPLDATAIFETSEASYYRKLCEGACSLPAKKLHGEVKVTVAVLDGTTPPKKWSCEELKAEALRDGGVLVSPNDLNLPQTIIDLRLENQAICEENAAIKADLATIKKRLDEIMDAYDFT